MRQIHDAKPSLFVALVHETLKRERCASRSDLAEAVKCRAARLRLHYDSEMIGEAIDQVIRVRGLPFEARPVPVPQGTEPDVRPSSQVEAAAILDRYGLTPKMISTFDAAAHTARLQAQLAAEPERFREPKQPRRPLRERLDEIFRGTP